MGVRVDFDRLVKKIKKEFNGYDLIDLLQFFYRYMNQEGLSEIDRLKRRPWIVMLLVKWAMLTTRPDLVYKPPFTNLQARKVLKLAGTLEKRVRLPSKNLHHHLFLRNIAYQQFMYQKDLSILALAQNQIMFGEIPDNHEFSKKFRQLSGVSIKDFNQISLVVSHFMSSSESITIDYFSGVFNEIRKDKIEAVLDLLSVDIKVAKEQVKLLDISKDGYSQIYEQTPFLNFPILKHNGEYLCFSKDVLNRAVEGFVYKFLKRNDPDNFGRKFGIIFERYARHGLEWSGLDFIDERCTQSIVGNGCKVVDYIVRESGCNIFIDAKGVELSYLGMVSDDYRIVQSKVKTSALKGMEQAMSLNNSLYKGGFSALPHTDESFLIVVTYKELYVGNGRLFYDSVGREKVDNIYSQVASESRIPLENVYFVTIEEFDLICSVVESKGILLSNILKMARVSDRDPSTAKFIFRDHLTDLIAGIDYPPYLREALNGLV